MGEATIILFFGGLLVGLSWLGEVLCDWLDL